MPKALRPNQQREITEKLYEKYSDIPPYKIKAILWDFQKGIRECLKEEGYFWWQKFMVLRVVEMKERKGLYNCVTKERTNTIPARKRLKAKISKNFLAEFEELEDKNLAPPEQD